MKVLATAVVILSASAWAAAAQTPKPTLQEPAPTPSSAVGAAGVQPRMLHPQTRHRAVPRPRGEPIVKGNPDVFVDSYGQLSTTIQP